MISYVVYSKSAVKCSHLAEAIQKELRIEWLACFPRFSQHGQEMLAPKRLVCRVDVGYIAEQASIVHIVQNVGCLQILQTCQEQLQQ
jgi:hypothetical protein